MKINREKFIAMKDRAMRIRDELLLYMHGSAPHIPDEGDMRWLRKNLFRHIALFAVTVMGEAAELDPPDFHFEVYESAFHQLTPKTQKFTNEIAPRGTAKTTKTRIILVWAICHDLFRNIILLSNTQQLSKDSLFSITQTFLDSEIIRALYGVFIPDNTTQNKEEVIFKHLAGDCDKPLHECRMKAFGVQQPIRGLNWGKNSCRPDLIVPDDMDRDDSSGSTVGDPEKIQIYRRLFMQVVEPALDKRRGKIYSVGTAVHEECLVMYFHQKALKGHKGWVSHFYQLEQPDGSSLWEEMWSKADIAQKKRELEDDGMLSIWYTEYQNEPSGEKSDRNITEEMLQYHDYYWGTLDGVDCLISASDPSDVIRGVHIEIGFDIGGLKKDRMSDYTGVVAVAKSPAVMQGTDTVLPSRYYTLEALEFKGRLDEVARVVFDFGKRYGRHVMRTETNNQIAVNQRIEDLAMQEDYPMYIDAIHMGQTMGASTHSKENRHLQMQPFFQQQRWFICNHERLRSQLLKLGNKPLHDDLLDAQYHAFRLLPRAVNYLESPMRAQKQGLRRDYIDVPAYSILQNLGTIV